MSQAQDNVLKAVVGGYNPPPFFFPQSNGSNASIRFVAWTGELAQLKKLVYDVLRSFSPHAKVLLKADKRTVADGPVWTRYHGDAPRSTVIGAIEQNERLIFQDGYTQLCVRDGDTGEYIALDEYDVLYIYSDDDRFAQICRNAGFEERPEGLISEQGHYRRAIDDAQQALERFVQALDLQEVP